MRRPSGEIPKQPITFLWERHKEIARRLVAGDRQCDIARDLGMTESRLSIIANSPEFKIQLDDLSAKADVEAADVAERLQRLSSQAVGVLEDVLAANKTPFNESLKVKVAESVLDRTGFGKESKISSKSLSATVSLKASEVLGQVLERMRSTEPQIGVLSCEDKDANEI